MKDCFAKKIEFFANVAIIIVAITLTAVLVKKFVFSEQPSASLPKESIAVGSKVDLPGVDWSRHERTLVLVISTDCHYCHESLPFYQKLSQETARRGDTQLIAVLPQDSATGEKYLESNDVAVRRVVQANPPNLGIGGTPTLLLVDRNGAITDTWFGKLAADQEQKVFGRVQSPIS